MTRTPCRSGRTPASSGPRSSPAKLPNILLGKVGALYLVPATGAVEIDGVRVNARDGAAIKDVEVLRVTAVEDSEIVLVDAA